MNTFFPEWCHILVSFPEKKPRYDTNFSIEFEKIDILFIGGFFIFLPTVAVVVNIKLVVHNKK